MDKLPKHVRITAGERERLASTLRTQYEKGVSLRELAEQTGRSYGFVHRLLTEDGVALRGRGGATQKKKK